jgi:hypothetical protein
MFLIYEYKYFFGLFFILEFTMMVVFIYIYDLFLFWDCWKFEYCKLFILIYIYKERKVF